MQVFIDLDKYFTKANSLEEYMGYVHQLLSKLMYAQNFYLASYNHADNSIQFLYNVDVKDESIPTARKFTLASEAQSPTAWVIANQKELEMKIGDNPRTQSDGQYWGRGTRAEHWFGVPLISQRDNCLGALVIQSYDAKIYFSDEDKSLFRLFTSKVTSALEKHKKDLRLQSSLSDKTIALEKELTAKKHAEKLQRALYLIAAKANETSTLQDLYREVHRIIDELLYAKNFFIALLDEDSNEISFPYYVDEKESELKPGSVIEVGDGVSSYVIRTQKPQLLSKERVNELITQGEIKRIRGALDFTCWLGVPMISSDILHGIIVVQSYDEKILFTESDQQLLFYVANHVATAIESAINRQERTDAQLKLAKQHRILEQQHQEVQDTIRQLKRTQRKLVEQEKMASLGGLVAGIAHEINTPLGICVTGVSHLVEELKYIKKAVNEETLTEDQLMDFFDEVDKAGQILTTNTRRAADLVQSFKQVAVDQSSNSIRELDLGLYIQEVLLSLQPRLKKVKHKIEVQCPEQVHITANAGVISQVLSNLIMNSIMHGFDGIERGNIAINVELKNDYVILRYADDGVGLDEQAMAQLFEPFYTTKRGDGGSGLGTHLVYNLVTSALKGRVEAKSKLNKGLAYLIKFPVHASGE
ncbi:sensor histidine kinase [Thalassotalea atypica]|uniref:sensor histidine kinase n=1 Tax=Thalassotalea atypica TaxID=2054316 RepID=UPI00257289BC|nr:GAF domain-containing sensor histidine kinase [Thalassotalea atypica]